MNVESVTAVGQPMAPSGSFSARVYESLRRSIILGEYPQGSRLAEQKLAEQLNVSRVPLREAIPQLEADGFITTLPRRSSRVTRWTKRSVDNLFDVRLGLEVCAAKNAARQARLGAETAELRETLLASQAGLESDDQYTLAIRISRFHESIADLANNPLLSMLMRRVTGRVTWLLYLTSKLDPDTAQKEHIEIVEAIESGNESLAEAVAFKHIERSREPSIAALIDLPPG